MSYLIVAFVIFISLLSVATFYSEKLELDLDSTSDRILVLAVSFTYGFAWVYAIPVTIFAGIGYYILLLMQSLKYKLNMKKFCTEIDVKMIHTIKMFKDKVNNEHLRSLLESELTYDVRHLPQKYKINSYNVTCNDANNPQIVIDSKELRVDVSIGFKHGHMLRQYVLRDGEVEVIKFGMNSKLMSFSHF